MKSTKKDNLKNDEINNNIKQIYLKKQGKLLVDYSTPINEIKLVNKLNYKRSSIDYQQQSFFEPLNQSFNQTENFELKKINSLGKQSVDNQISQLTNQITNEKKKDDDTVSRKSIKSLENFDKRNSNKRKTSTVLELKNYDQHIAYWTEDTEVNQTKSKIKKLENKNKLDILIDKDQESNRSIKNDKIKNGFFQNTERNRTWTCVLMLGFLILSIVIYSKFLEKDTKNKDSKEYRIKFRENELRTFDLLDDNGNRVLTVYYGLKVPRDLKPIKCSKLR